MAAWARAHADWLGKYCTLADGTPSYDTFRRLLLRLHPERFAECFLNWTQSLPRPAAPEAPSPVPPAPLPAVLAVDGKTLRHSTDRTRHPRPLQTVSAWASNRRLVLAQVAVAADRGELSALPALLGLLDCQGCVVTLDALGCHPVLHEQIVAAGADYVLAVKGNQPALHEEVQEFWDAVAAGTLPAEGMEEQTHPEWEHGRRLALNLLRQCRTSGIGVKNWHLRAGWDVSPLKKILNV